MFVTSTLNRWFSAKRPNSVANALELRLSCSNPSKWWQQSTYNVQVQIWNNNDVSNGMVELFLPPPVCSDLTILIKIQYVSDHYNGVIISAMASQISSLTVVYLNFYSGRRRSKKTSKPRVTGLCAGNSPVTGEFSAQMASNTENFSIGWRHYVALRWWLLDSGHQLG